MVGSQREHGAIVGILAGGIAIAVGVMATPFTGATSLAMVAAGIQIGMTALTATVVGGVGAGYIARQFLPNDLYLPLYKISPEEILSNKILIFDVNFFNPKEAVTEELVNGQEIEQKSSAAQLQSVVSKWYYTIRNFAIVALLSILVYMGIRIIISSTAQDKAKYKQRLFDWLVAMCMLFFLHYIMAFAITVTELITDSLRRDGPAYVAFFSESDLQDYHWDFKQKEYVKETVAEEGPITNADAFKSDSPRI